MSRQSCAKCGEQLYEGDMFCGNCGEKVPRCAKCGEQLCEGDLFCSNCGEKVLHCAKCGAILAGNAKFCVKCGHCAVMKCNECGSVLPDGAMFCSKCGAPVHADQADTVIVNKAPRVVEDSTPAVSCSSKSEPAQSAPPAPVSCDEAHAGEFVKFGNYPQEHGESLEPIEWLVLENDGKTALLISRYGLDCKQFHHSSEDISWRNSDLRNWLNSDFLSKAFNSDEQRQIADTKIHTGSNPNYGTKGCGDTQDKLFCLSIEEAKKYFASDDTRSCQPTAYAMSQNAWRSVEGNCVFWLRSPGYGANYASDVFFGGAVRSCGDSVCDEIIAVRPALRIILSPSNSKLFAVYHSSRSCVADSCAAKNGIAVSSSSKLDPSQSEPPALRFKARAGEYVKFGNYPQESGESLEPIEWLVLECNKKTALLISKYGLDCKQFHRSSEDISWRDSDLRKWLNGDFLNKAFTSSEQRMIANSKVNTGDNPEYGTRSCGVTQDKLFCLSIEEANKFFASDEARKCKPTAYAVSQNANRSRTGNCWFWLRSCGYRANRAADVNDNGAVFCYGYNVGIGNFAVRPALRIKL